MKEIKNISSVIDLAECLPKIVVAEESSARSFFDKFLGTKTKHVSSEAVHIYEGADAVTEYVKSFIEYYDDVDNRIIDQLAQSVAGQYRRAATPILDANTAVEVMSQIYRVFPSFISFFKKTIKLLIIDAQANGRNSEASIYQTSSGIQSIIRIYRINNNCTLTTAQVLLHELGHLLHMNSTGKVKALPESFRRYLLSIGANIDALTDVQMLELFADTFLIAFTAKCNVYGDPFPEIPYKVKQHCINYMEWFLNNRPQ